MGAAEGSILLMASVAMDPVRGRICVLRGLRIYN